MSVRNPSGYPTILSGDLAGNDGANFTNNADNVYHVVTTSNGGPTAILDGFTISGGNANGTSPSNIGGGLYNSGGSPMIRRCFVKGNYASLYGSGVCNSSSSPTLVNCVVSGNATASTGYGGGIYNSSGSTPTVTNCTFNGNSARYGGGIYCYSGYAAKLNNCILWGNTATTGPQISGSATVTYSCVQGGLTGTGNINSDPLFVNAAAVDLHLTGPSPCIDAGDPTSEYSLEPEPDGGRINMGAYGNTPEAETKGWLLIDGYNQVSRTRVSRTTFEYQFTVTMRNAGSTPANSIVATLSAVPGNVQIIQGVVHIPTIPAGGSLVSQETFTIRVDRSIPVSGLAISWKVTYSAGTQMVASFLSLTESIPADFNGDGIVDASDVMILEACASGPAVLYDPNNLPKSCSFAEGFSGTVIPADFDWDGDVDQQDFGQLQTLLGLTTAGVEQ